MVILHIKLKGITKFSNEANIWPEDPSLTLGRESIGQNQTFSENGHIVYQIRRNHKMQQHGSKYFAGRPLPGPGYGLNRSKINVFRTWSYCISNLKESQNAAAKKQIPCPWTPS